MVNSNGHRPIIGPHSQRRAFASLDGRGLVARRMKAVRAELVAELGGEEALTTMQRLLVDGIVLRWARAQMLWAAVMEKPEDVAEEAERRLAWHLNGLDRALLALGLESRAHDETPGLAALLAADAPK